MPRVLACEQIVSARRAAVGAKKTKRAVDFRATSQPVRRLQESARCLLMTPDCFHRRAASAPALAATRPLMSLNELTEIRARRASCGARGVAAPAERDRARRGPRRAPRGRAGERWKKR